MDNRRLIMGMVLALGLVMFWPRIVFLVGTKLGYDMTIHPPTTQMADSSTTQPSSQPGQTGQAGQISPIQKTTLHPYPATQPAVASHIGSDEPKDATFHIGLSISPRGAGLDGVVLNEFQRAAQSKDRYVYQQPYPTDSDKSRSLATAKIFVAGNDPVDLATQDWSLESSDNQSATYSVIVGDTRPLIKVSKTYRVLPISDASEGYEIVVSQKFENLTDQDLKFHVELNGPTLPPHDQERGGDRHIIAGYGGDGILKQVIHNTAEEITKDGKPYLTDTANNPVLWAGTASVYFNAILRPLGWGKDDDNSTQDFIAGVNASLVDPTDHHVALTFDTSEKPLAKGETATLNFRAFFGPRQRNVLESDYYASFPRSFDHTLVLTSGPCAKITSDTLVSILVAVLRGLHWIFRDWGLAIIGLVAIVRLILHPITRKSQIAMSAMSKMGPEIEKLKKKYGDNKEELNKAMVEVYKTQGATPIMGCLPMLLQMPIWIALWQSLQTTFELRHASFLWGFTWIHDLSKPDHLLEWPPVPFLFWTFSGLNVLPIVMGAIFYLQMKFQPKPASITPEQAQQQKMMQWMMPVLFPLMLYSGPSGLNLYILTSTGIGIIESKVIRDHIKQREASGVPLTKPSLLGRVMRTIFGPLTEKFADLQKQAEQVRQQSQKRK